MKVVAAYFHRATRHLTASWIPLLPLFAAVYAARSLFPSDWSINGALIIMLGLTLRALWRAGHKAVALSPDGYLVITNPWRSYRLRMDRVAGFTWTPPAWMGRDGTPIVAVVEKSDGGSKQIRIITLSGKDALEAMHELGLKEFDDA